MGAFFSGKPGTYFWIGAERSSLPCSTSCMAATAVSIFEIEASRYTVAGLAGTWFSTSASP
jgi:hypothetical protein